MFSRRRQGVVVIDLWTGEVAVSKLFLRPAHTLIILDAPYLHTFLAQSTSLNYSQETGHLKCGVG